MQRLPIDEVIPAVLGAAREHGAVVLVAPPGAGKTTRVPPALLDRASLQGEIVVLQPRRLAARLAAVRVAEERGESIGDSIGYEVRFDRQVSAKTRIRFVTEGILTRRLVRDPHLAGVGAVIIDELHERHLTGDLALALTRRLQQSARPDLLLIAMSATLDPGPVAQFLGDAPVIVSEGRTHPVSIEYAPDLDKRPLEKQIAAAVRQLVVAGLDGDVLVFLPGAAEIRRAADALTEYASKHDLLVVPLHGDLPAADQDRAVRRADKRKIILATNVAETSVTIDGVVAVVDSGLARIARHSPWSGLPTLAVEPISQASATQRAGRAGRTRPGHCIRLYGQHDHDSRRPFDVPEIARADLAEAVLELHAAGIADARTFGWFESPPEAAVIAAETLLGELGAVSKRGALTAIGEEILSMPLHPRQGRLLVEARARGVGAEGAILAALLGQRELRTERREGPGAAPRVSGPSDLLEELDRLQVLRKQGMRAERCRGLAIDYATARAVDRTASQLDKANRGASKTARPRTPQAIDEALLIASLAGYPDRVGKRRAPHSPDIVFADGGAGVLSPTSVVLESPFVVAVDVEERGRGGGRAVTIRRASAVDPSWLIELFEADIAETNALEWNEARKRVEGVSRLAYRGLVIDESWRVEAARGEPEAEAILAAKVAERGIEAFVDRDALAALNHRLAFVAAHAPDAGIGPLEGTMLKDTLASACSGAISLMEVKSALSVEALIAARPGLRNQLDRLAPAHVALPGRKQVPVHYEMDRPPWIESRMQDFFGLTDGPRLASGRVPVVLHLLAPNRRAVQVTTDLAGFWQRHYPELRRQLMRRYPRHAWPENPLSVQRGEGKGGG